MKRVSLYTHPYVRIVEVNIERGFSESETDGFEQPGYGGEDNI